MFGLDPLFRKGVVGKYQQQSVECSCCREKSLVIALTHQLPESCKGTLANSVEPDQTPHFSVKKKFLGYLKFVIQPAVSKRNRCTFRRGFASFFERGLFYKERIGSQTGANSFLVE